MRLQFFLTFKGSIGNPGFFIPCLMLGLLANMSDVEPGSVMPIILLTVGIASGACSYAGLYSSHADTQCSFMFFSIL